MQTLTKLAKPSTASSMTTTMATLFDCWCEFSIGIYAVVTFFSAFSFIYTLVHCNLFRFLVCQLPVFVVSHSFAVAVSAAAVMSFFFFFSLVYRQFACVHFPIKINKHRIKWKKKKNDRLFNGVYDIAASRSVGWLIFPPMSQHVFQ